MHIQSAIFGDQFYLQGLRHAGDGVDDGGWKVEQIRLRIWRSPCVIYIRSGRRVAAAPSGSQQPMSECRQRYVAG